MKPALILALIGGGMTGVATNMLLAGGLRSPAAPGSIIAVLAQTAQDSYVSVILSVVLSCAVTFVIAAVILRASRKRDLAAEDTFADAVSRTTANKGKSSDALAGLAASAGGGTVAAAAPTAATAQAELPPLRSIVFACDAGMGSSAMGASVLRNKFKKAGVEDVMVTNKAIANLDGSEDLVITQNQLTERAKGQHPGAVHVSVDNFMNSPRYDEVVDMVRRQREAGN